MLDRLGILVRGVKIDLVSVVFGWISGPQGFHGLDPFTHQSESAVWVGPVVGHLFEVPTGAHPEQHATIGEHVEAGHLLGCVDQIALDDECDAGAQLQRRGGGCHGTERHERIESVVVHLWEVRSAWPRRLPGCRNVAVLGQPDRLEATVLQGDAQFDGTDGVLGGKEAGSEVHVAET